MLLVIFKVCFSHGFVWMMAFRVALCVCVCVLFGVNVRRAAGFDPISFLGWKVFRTLECGSLTWFGTLSSHGWWALGHLWCCCCLICCCVVLCGVVWFDSWCVWGCVCLAAILQRSILLCEPFTFDICSHCACWGLMLSVDVGLFVCVYCVEAFEDVGRRPWRVVRCWVWCWVMCRCLLRSMSANHSGVRCNVLVHPCFVLWFLSNILVHTLSSRSCVSTDLAFGFDSTLLMSRFDVKFRCGAFNPLIHTAFACAWYVLCV